MDILPDKPVLPDDAPPTGITSMLSDNSGGISSMRVLMMVWGIGTFLVWAVGSILAFVHGIYVPVTVSPEVITILLGLTGAKVVQRGFEK